MSAPGLDVDVDVLVVGAGPAGAAAALAARRAGASVLLLDRAEFPRDKVCGDGVASHALDVLAELGVDPAAVVAGSAPIRTLDLRSPAGVVARRDTRRPGWVVPRAVLDARLRDAAVAAGAEVATRRVREVRPVPGGVDVGWSGGRVRAGVVVGADGAESTVRRAVGVPAARGGTVALALRGYAPSDGWPAGEQLLTMTREHWPAYAWFFPVGDGTANVGYGELLRGAPPNRAHLLERLRALLPGVDPTALRAHRLPLSTGRVRQPDGRVLLVGDAAGLINPVTGEGIFYAVLSGMLAGRAATGAGDPGRVLRRTVRAHLGVHLRHTDALAALTRRPWLLDAGVRAGAARQDVFDEVVELGLGDGRVSPRTGLHVARAALHR